MAYKWTVEDVDRLTWPQINALLREIEKLPPGEVQKAWQYKARVEKELVDANAGIGLPTRKGKVKRRKDGD